ncbi:HalX domain-containing protein [Haloarchaeobius sp. HRN-SO-5]|uniref:HalX domain-containing protein n=1 Tax=Haloarchaeobius sp. HRN-SO-5 TaxID=3446118 RepID=UPI003EBDCB64
MPPRTGAGEAVADPPSVLLVEDDPDLADLYATWLSDACTVTTASDGRRALEAMDDSLDVVLLDRRMPGLSGDEVLSTIRTRGLDARVAMVTAVEPDFDVVQMGFDDYLVEPVSEDDLRSTVDQLLLRSAYDEQIQGLFALASKKALLTSQQTEADVRSSETYARLEDQLHVMRAQLDETMAELSTHDEYGRVCQDLSRTN